MNSTIILLSRYTAYPDIRGITNDMYYRTNAAQVSFFDINFLSFSLSLRFHLNVQSFRSFQYVRCSVRLIILFINLFATLQSYFRSSLMFYVFDELCSRRNWLFDSVRKFRKMRQTNCSTLGSSQFSRLIFFWILNKFTVFKKKNPLFHNISSKCIIWSKPNDSTSATEMDIMYTHALDHELPKFSCEFPIKLRFVCIILGVNASIDSCVYKVKWSNRWC